MEMCSREVAVELQATMVTLTLGISGISEIVTAMFSSGGCPKNKMGKLGKELQKRA